MTEPRTILLFSNFSKSPDCHSSRQPAVWGWRGGRSDDVGRCNESADIRRKIAPETRHNETTEQGLSARRRLDGNFFDHFPDRECQTNHSNGQQAGVHELVRGKQFAGNLAVSEEKLWFEHQYFATMQLF